MLTGLVFSMLYTKAQKDRVCDSRYASFGLEGKTLEVAVNLIGSIHDEYQEHIFNRMKSLGMQPENENFNGFVKAETIDFFSGKGIDASNLPEVPAFNLDEPVINFTGITLSAEAERIIAELQAVLSEKGKLAAVTFVQQLDNLKLAALNLSDETEAVAVGGTISVAVHSFQYWENNFHKWENYLAGTPAGKKKPCLGSIGFADVTGAINGGTGGGLVAGPGGALAGAVLGSSTSSLGAAFGCAMGMLFNWW